MKIRIVKGKKADKNNKKNINEEIVTMRMIIIRMKEQGTNILRGRRRLKIT